jgi:hypothetical protein
MIFFYGLWFWERSDQDPSELPDPAQYVPDPQPICRSTSMLFWVFMLLLLFYRNHSEKSINSILDYISTSKQMELLQNFYETTLDALRDAKVKSSLLQLEYIEGRFSPFSKHSISYLWLPVTDPSTEL